MPFPSPTPAAVRRAREQAKMSEGEAAGTIGLPQPRWSEYEHGRREMRGTDWAMYRLLTDQHPEWKLMPR